MSIIKELLQEYLQMENKTIGNIEILANKYGITPKEVIAFLNQYNIKAPKLFSRFEAIDMNGIEELKQNYIIKQTSKEMGLDNDISVAVSVQQWFSDLGFNDKENLKKERVKIICYYYKTLGIDLFEEFCTFIENKIKNDRALTLENDLNGNFNTSGKSIKTQIDDWMLKTTRDIVFEGEDRRKEKIEEGFKIINSSFKREHKRKMKEASKIIDDVLGSVE